MGLENLGEIPEASETAVPAHDGYLRVLGWTHHRTVSSEKEVKRLQLRKKRFVDQATIWGKFRHWDANY